MYGCIFAKNGVFPSKSFHGDDAKRKLDERPSSKKNDPDGPAEKTNKKVQGRETITEPCYKNSGVVIAHENCKSLGSEIRCFCVYDVACVGAEKEL